MDYRISPEERATFKRCRRQWDFASPHRRNLALVGAVSPALPASLIDALTVYYYPGTWDWQHQLKQSLVHKAIERSLTEAAATEHLAMAALLIDRYDDWASSVDDFAPVKIAHDVRALVPDPRWPDSGLFTVDGLPIVYTCRIDLLAVDAADEYWVVRHLFVAGDWHEPQWLIRDEEAVAACWAWEQDYLGVEVAGTIHNEWRIDTDAEGPTAQARTGSRRRSVAQNEPSGGGRSVGQHRRVHAAPTAVGDFDQITVGGLRRTWVRRTRAEITGVPKLIAAEALEMTGAAAIYPHSGSHCHSCVFSAPCLACYQGADPAAELANRFQTPTGAAEAKPRLGQSTWGFGRGGAPPPGWQSPPVQ